jgi:predicted transcriptional regulator
MIAVADGGTNMETGVIWDGCGDRHEYKRYQGHRLTQRVAENMPDSMDVVKKAIASAMRRRIRL